MKIAGRADRDQGDEDRLQVKRFNVRQAIDQHEIDSFFMLVPKE